MDVKATWLIAPTVKNSSCNHPRFSASLFEYIGPLDVIQALLILMLTIGIIGANFLVIFVINHRRYSPYIHPQPRYLLTSLALNDFAIGLLIAPFGVLPALFHCWPYGEIFCQIQALLRGALSQQSAVILVCMAVDRYMCTLHPDKYHQHSSKKGCVAILSITWTLCLTMFGLLVLPKGYYFNNTGLLVCEPFFSKPSYRILATCSFYFPTTMILMYCYGSSFHVSRFHNYNCNNVGITPSVAKIPEPPQQQLQIPNASTSLEILPPSQTTPTIMNDKPLYEIITQERRLNGSASRTMAAMSLGFIVMVTPWTIQEVVAACTGSKVPPFLDFIVTWTAISNSFWNPFLYWLLNAHFRRISKEIIPTKWCYSCRNDNDDGSITPQKSRCCSLTSVECDTMQLPLPPGPPSSRPPRTDIEGLSEKYWGEILERTVSSNSLHLLQRSYGLDGNTSHHNHILHNHHHHHHLHFNNNNNNNNINTSEFIENSKQSEHLSKFSNSEPKLYEHFHDINCAKNKAFLNDNHRHSIKGLPDI